MRKFFVLGLVVLSLCGLAGNAFAERDNAGGIGALAVTYLP
jgi:hypothetical protein